MLQRRYRTRISIFLVSAVLTVVALSAAYRVAGTIHGLEIAEAERDRWPQPAAVIDPLQIEKGSVVADVGCGAGYFTLKLSAVVGKEGRVLAVDLRRPSLLFLRIRAFLRGDHNLRIVQGEPDTTHLPAGGVDAVLIASALHEFTNPRVILAEVFRALRSNGRLVVVDRGPTSGEDQTPRSHNRSHPALSATQAEMELRQAGFGIGTVQDRFVEGPGGEQWWLLVAGKLE